MLYIKKYIIYHKLYISYHTFQKLHIIYIEPKWPLLWLKRTVSWRLVRTKIKEKTGDKLEVWNMVHERINIPFCLFRRKILTWCSNPSANLLIVEEGNLGRQFPPAPSEVAIWKSSKERKLQPKPLLGMTHVNSEMPQYSLSSLS